MIGVREQNLSTKVCLHAPTAIPRRNIRYDNNNTQSYNIAERPAN